LLAIEYEIDCPKEWSMILQLERTELLEDPLAVDGPRLNAFHLGWPGKAIDA
jgi:hypothetical protein